MWSKVILLLETALEVARHWDGAVEDKADLLAELESCLRRLQAIRTTSVTAKTVTIDDRRAK